MEYVASGAIRLALEDHELQSLMKRVDSTYLEFVRAVNSEALAVSETDKFLDSLISLFNSIRQKEPLLADLMEWSAFAGAATRMVRTTVPERFKGWCREENKRQDTQTKKREVWE